MEHSQSMSCVLGCAVRRCLLSAREWRHGCFSPALCCLNGHVLNGRTSCSAFQKPLEAITDWFRVYFVPVLARQREMWYPAEIQHLIFVLCKGRYGFAHISHTIRATVVPLAHSAKNEELWDSYPVKQCTSSHYHKPFLEFPAGMCNLNLGGQLGQ